MGKCCLRKVPISGIGILNHQGSEENVKQILNLLSDLHLTYEEKFNQALKNVTEWNVSLYMHYVRFSRFYWQFEILDRKIGGKTKKSY